MLVFRAGVAGPGPGGFARISVAGALTSAVVDPRGLHGRALSNRRTPSDLAVSPENQVERVRPEPMSTCARRDRGADHVADSAAGTRRLVAIAEGPAEPSSSPSRKPLVVAGLFARSQWYQRRSQSMACFDLTFDDLHSVPISLRRAHAKMRRSLGRNSSTRHGADASDHRPPLTTGSDPVRPAGPGVAVRWVSQVHPREVVDDVPRVGLKFFAGQDANLRWSGGVVEVCWAQYASAAERMSAVKPDFYYVVPDLIKTSCR